MEPEFLTTGEAAKIANRSAESIRAYERQGKLKAERTQSGIRLFRTADVQKLAAELAKKGSKR